MAADGFVMVVRGIPEMKAAFSDMTAALRKRVLRNALSAGARVVRDDAKRNAPVLAAENMTAPYRKPGTVRQAIRVRTSKASRRAGNVGVFVNVKPAGPGQRGAKSKNDPFYWRFLNFGTRKMSARPFLTNAANKLPEALRIFESAVFKFIARANIRGDTK